MHLDDQAAHGVKLFVTMLSKEVAASNAYPAQPLLDQLPYIVWYLTSTLSTVMTRDLRG